MSGGIKGLDSLMRKYGKLGESIVGQHMEQAVGNAGKVVQGEAKLLCSVNDGELRNSIKCQVDAEDGQITGIVYTNKKYAPYVEFGTGPKGEKDHAGISPLITPSYSQSPWWIHESQIGRETAEKYHMTPLETGQGTFYRTSGQAAQPFLYPALKNNEERVTRNIANYLCRKIKEACKP